MKYDGTAVDLFLSCGIVIPFCVIFLLVMIIWSSHEKLSSAINKEQNHANLAALALTGLVFSTFTVVLDIVALVLVVQGKHEFSPNYSNLNSLCFVIGTTVCDAIAVLVAYITLACITRLYFTSLKPQIVWLVILICFAPLFCLTSHSGYIIVAWVSDTQHAGPATSFYIISFLYYFIPFRQLYQFLNRKFRLSTNGQTAEETNTTNDKSPSFNPFQCRCLVVNADMYECQSR